MEVLIEGLRSGAIGEALTLVFVATLQEILLYYFLWTTICRCCCCNYYTQLERDRWGRRRYRNNEHWESPSDIQDVDLDCCRPIAGSRCRSSLCCCGCRKDGFCQCLCFVC